MGPLPQYSRELRRLLLRVAAGVATFMGAAVPASAQISATETANVEAIVVDGLTIAVVRHLDYGVVPHNTSRTFAYTSASAAKVRIWGNRNARIEVTLAYPAALTNGTSQITALTWSPAYNSTADDPSTATVPATNPWRMRLQTDLSGGRGWGQVYIGGSVTIANQALGTYTGVITITARYD